MDITYNGKTEHYNAENVYLYVNGSRIENLPMPAIIFEGTTLVPAREVFEPMGADVEWEEETHQVTIKYKEHTIVITINSETAQVDDKTEALLIPARIINRKTMIPARFIAQSIGMKVEWDSDTRIINIREAPEPEPTTIEITSESTTETITESTTEYSTETTTERKPVNLNDPECDNGVLKITADGKLGDFSSIKTDGNKIKYTLCRTNLPSEESYSFDDDYIKKVNFSETAANDKNLTQITIYLKEPKTPAAYISKDLKTFVVDFVNEAPKFEDLYVIEFDDNTPFASDSDLPSNSDDENDEINPPNNLNELPADENVYYKDNCLYIKKNSNFNLSKIKETDNYQHLKYTIDTNSDLSNTLPEGKYKINSDKIDYVEITHSKTTSISISEKKIYAYNISENSNYICVKPVLPKEKYKKIVVIDAGHGGDDPGAESEKNNIVEKELTLSVTKKAVNMIEKDGRVKAYAVRLDDTFYTRPERAAFGDEIGDMFISIHANSFSGEHANGTEIWYYPHSNDETIGVTCEELAETLLKNMIANLKSTNRGVKSTDYDVLAFTHIPASLCEIGFITNPDEAAKLKTDEYQNLIADAVYKSVIEIFEKYTPQR